MSLEFLPEVVEGVASIVLAGMGREKKCVVCDLDNTLWGGVIGEDGLEGIEIGKEGLGQAFLNFQYYLKSLKERGVIIAVCSKNDEENAKLPFTQHPDMVLKEEDISIFVANWASKVDNIRYIAEKLNIGLDSLVFLDDSPFERNHVRSELPQVFVPEMPEDPADYAQYLNRLNCFETTSFSIEDSKRAQFYKQQVDRDVARKGFTDISQYLQSLDMTAELERFDSMHMPRIVQLVQRTNQFNLTTIRYNEAECMAFMSDEENCFPIYVTLSDKYGDSGLISVVIVEKKDETAFIREWCMSCRVLNRGVEPFTMNAVVQWAKDNGCEQIVGDYIPTKKNAMVKEFYGQFGFTAQPLADGASRWTLHVADYTEQKTWIRNTKGAPCPA